jgi:hypothetical protein
VNSEFQYVHDALEGHLEQGAGVALDPDHVQAVLEGARRVAVGDSTGDLIGAEEAEPDCELAAEIGPPTGQDSTAG